MISEFEKLNLEIKDNHLNMIYSPLTQFSILCFETYSTLPLLKINPWKGITFFISLTYVYYDCNYFIRKSKLKKTPLLNVQQIFTSSPFSKWYYHLYITNVVIISIVHKVIKLIISELRYNIIIQFEGKAPFYIMFMAL